MNLRKQLSSYIALNNYVEAFRENTSSIVLTDAITNGLTDLQLKGSEVKNKPETFLDSVVAKGGTEQRNLPAEYTQLEYITFPSGAYIKTGIVPKTFDYEVGFKGAFGILPGGPNCAWGFMGDGLIPRWICATYGSSYLLNANTTRTFGNADTNTHTFVGRVYEKNGIYCWSSEFDGVIQQNDQTLDNTANWEANTLEMYVGARNNNSTAGNYGLITANHWWCKKAGVMIVDYIPAKRNGDNVLGMYDLVSGQFFTNQGTGDFIAGPDAVPTPDTPIDITSNNGVLKVSPNLFDKNASYALYNGYINNVSVGGNTTLRDYSGGDKTIIIKVAPNTTYTVTRATNLGSVYDRIRCAAFTTLPSSGSTGVILCNYMNKTQANATFTTLSDTQYVAINVRNSGAVGDDWTQFVDAFQLEKGSTATQYRPYGQIYTDGTVETIESHGKNLFDPTKVLFGYYRNRTTGNKTQDSHNFMSSDDGYIPCLPNTTYTFVGTNKTNGTYSKYNTIYFFDSAKNYLGASPYEVSQPTTGTTPSNCRYLQVRSNPLDNSTPIQDAFAQFNWQLEQGSTPTEYEPYFNGGTATAEMLLKVGDYQDEQEILSGDVTRKIGVKVFDGTEDWTKEQSFYCDTLTGVLQADHSCYCTHYQGIMNNSTVVTDSNTCRVGYHIGSDIDWNRLYIYADRSLYATAQDFANYLAQQYAAGTPVIVIYPLNASTTETVSPQKLLKNPVTVTEASIDNLEVTTTEAEHTVPMPDYPLDIMCNNGVLKVGPNNDVIAEGTPETVTITGKNLLDINKTSGTGYLNTSGELVPYNDYYCSDYIEVKPSTVYTYTETMKSAVDGNYIRFCFYDSNKTFIPPRQGDDKTYKAKTYTYKITSPVNAKYIRISSHSDFVKGQLEESIRPTKYEEYYQASFALEDLLKLSDYQDVQSVLDGVVTRNVGVKVLDGTENWTRYGTGRFASPLIGSKKQDSQEAPFATHFVGTSDNNVPVKDGYMSVFNGSIAPTSGTLGINYQATPELTQFKQWLADQYAAGTPVIVVYPLADTVEETVESRDVFITSGTNTIERNSEYVASDGITVKYKKLR